MLLSFPGKFFFNKNMVIPQTWKKGKELVKKTKEKRKRKVQTIYRILSDKETYSKHED